MSLREDYERLHGPLTTWGYRFTVLAYALQLIMLIAAVVAAVVLLILMGSALVLAILNRLYELTT